MNSSSRILYIEDDKLLCTLFEMSIEPYGFEVAVAYNGTNGLAMHAAEPFDLVVIDYQLPDMTGTEIIRQLLADDPDLATIIITAEGNEEIAVEAFRLGVHNYIIKDGKDVYLKILPNIILSSLQRTADSAARKKAEIALKNSEERYRQIADISSDWVWEMNAELKFSYLSEGFRRLTGLDPEFILGGTREAVLLPEDKVEHYWKQHLLDMETRKEFRNFQYNFKSSQGDLLRLSINGSPLFDDSGEFIGYRGTCSDITEFVQIGTKFRDSEARMSHLLASSSIIIYACKTSENYAVTFVSDNIRAMLGYEPDEVLNSSSFWASRVHPDDARRVAGSFDCVSERGNYSEEYRFRKADGAYVWLHDSLHLINDEAGKPKEIVGTWSDISERKRAEEGLRLAHDKLELRVAERTSELEASQSHLENILDLAPEAIIITDDNFIIRLFNQGAEKIFGRAAKDVIGKSINVLIPAKFHADHGKFVNRFAQTHENYLLMGKRSDIWGVRKDGSEFPAEASVSKFTADGQMFFTVMLRDITKRKQLEAGLRDQEAQLRLVTDSLPVLILSIDANERYRFVNQAGVDLYGLPREEIIGKLVKDIHIDTEYAKLEPIIKKVLSGEKVSIETDINYPDGRRRNLQVLYVPQMTSEGEVIGFFSLATDVTNQKRLANLFDEAIESLSEAFAIYDENDRLVHMNQKYKEYFSEHTENLSIGETFENIIRSGIACGQYPEAKGREDAWLAERLAAHRSPQGYLTQENSDGHWLRISESRTPSGFTAGLRIDITEIKQAEKVIVENARQLQELLENSPIGVAIVTHNLDGTRTTGDRLFINDALARMFGGTSGEQMINLPIKDSWVDLGQLEEVELTLKSGKDLVNFEARRLRMDGSVWWTLMNSRPIRYNGQKCTVIWHADITERMIQEDQLHQAMDEIVLATQAKSDFLANMSHELRTPLNAILGFSEMIGGQYLGPIGDLQYVEYAKDIENSGRYLLDMVNDILDIERIEAGKFEIHKKDIDVDPVINECLKFLQLKAEQDGVALSASVPDNLSPLNVDRRVLLQVLINLLTNAVKFTPRGGEVRLGVRTASAQHVFEVRDTGIGIPAEKIPGLTEPFAKHDYDPYKSKDGVGLGLAICNALVEQHAGQLKIESEVGAGTVVTVMLPTQPPHTENSAPTS